jgi:hypothetical protein
MHVGMLKRVQLLVGSFVLRKFLIHFFLWVEWNRSHYYRGHQMAYFTTPDD